MGAADFRDVLHHWEHYGLERGTCVEIGCGAGRMTAQLAETFPSVVALDVSKDQIELAKQLVGTRRASVLFVQVDTPTIPLESGTCSAVFSSHVFQHFPDFDGVVSYLRDAFRVLMRGGSVCFHLPVAGAHRRSSTSWARLALHNAAVRVGRLVGVLRVMEYHRYSPQLVFQKLEAIGFDDVELRVFDMASNGDAYSFFLARRP